MSPDSNGYFESKMDLQSPHPGQSEKFQTMCKTEMCRNWEKGYCQYDTKVSWIKRLKYYLSSFWIFSNSAHLLMGGMNFKSVTTYRKIIKLSCVKNSMDLSTTAATDSDARSYTQGRSHPPHLRRKSMLRQQILPQMHLFIAADFNRLAPLIIITASAVKLKDCPRTVTI